MFRLREIKNQADVANIIHRDLNTDLNDFNNINFPFYVLESVIFDKSFVYLDDLDLHIDYFSKSNDCMFKVYNQDLYSIARPNEEVRIQLNIGSDFKNKILNQLSKTLNYDFYHRNSENMRTYSADEIKRQCDIKQRYKIPKAAVKSLCIGCDPDLI